MDADTDLDAVRRALDADGILVITYSQEQGGWLVDSAGSNRMSQAKFLEVITRYAGVVRGAGAN